MRNEDQAVDGAIRKALAGHTVKSQEGCPDENVVTAYLEDRLLQASEKRHFENHASTCPHCQELLALAIKLAGAQDTSSSSESASHPSRTVLFHFSVPLSAIALLIVAVAVGVVFYRELRTSRLGQPRTETSQARAPSEKPVTAQESEIAPSAAKSGVSGGLSDAFQKGGTTARTLKHDAPEISGPSEKTPGAPPSVTPARQSSPLATLNQKETDQDKLAALASRDEVASRPGAVPVVAGSKAKLLEAEEKDAVLLSMPVDRKKAEVAQVGAISAATQADASENVLRMDIPLTPQTVILSYSQQFSQREDAARMRQMQASEGRRALRPKSQAEAGTPPTRKLGDRTFSLISGYWIDSECGRHPHAEVLETTDKAPEYARILKAFPLIVELRMNRVPVLLHFNGKNYVLR